MSSQQQPRILIYATSTCSDCVRSKRFLEEHGLVYEYFDIADDPALPRLVMATNARLGVQKLTRVPIVQIGDLTLSEPTNDELAAALGITL